MILETIASAIFWNSSRIFEINSAFVQAAASPTIIENKCGIKINPDAVEKSAASTDDIYAIVTAIRRSLEAFLPI